MLAQFEGPETTLPAPLFTFLQQLEETRSSDAVWELFQSLCAGIGLPAIVYIYRNPDSEAGWAIRSTEAGIDADRLADVADFADRNSLSPVLLHSRRPKMSDTEYNLHRQFLTRLGMPAGIALPVRSGDPLDEALFAIGTSRSKAECKTILERFGCALHMAAMASHARHSALYRLEFVKRAQLTPKQIELVALVGQGLLDKQIAHKLGISFSAVRQRLAAVQQKTGLRNRAHLAASAMRMGLARDPLTSNCKNAAA